MHPEEFMSYWQLTRSELGQLLGVSVPTINHWFIESESKREVPTGVFTQLALIHAAWLNWEVQDNYLSSNVHALYQLAVNRKRLSN